MKGFGALLSLAAVAGAEFLVKKNRPVSKVINLLKTMAKQLEKEQEDDEKIYDQLVCWCKANKKGKSAAIKEAEAEIVRIQTLIEESKGKIGTYETEIKYLSKELEENKQSLETAAKLRKEAAESFIKEEKDMLQSIEALKAAIIVLERHNKTKSMMQKKDMDNILKLITREAKAHKDIIDESLLPSSERFVANLLETKQTPSYQAYSSQSGEIFGILRDMLDTFKSNLSESQKQEKTDAEAFIELKAAKEQEIDLATTQLDEKKQHLAAAKDALTNGKQDIINARANVDADTKFLLEVEAKCKSTDFEWANRQKTRQEEIMAVHEALKILTDDDAHDLFSKVLKFTQLKSVRALDNRREKAARVLRAFPRLAAVATNVKLDAFTKVKAKIDEMVTVLRKEKADEVKQRDSCIENMNDTDKETTKTKREHDEAVAMIDQFDATIDTLAKEVKELEDGIKEDESQLKKLGEERAEQNKEFEQTVAEQKETVKLLTSAMNVLKKFFHEREVANTRSTVAIEPNYESNLLSDNGTAFLQQDPEEKDSVVGAPPPETFQTYQKNRGANGVIGMITQIIHEAEMMTAEAERDEKDNQESYEVFVTDTNKMIEKAKRDIVNKTEEKAVAEQDRSAQIKMKTDAETEIAALGEKTKALHQQCDFLLNNFEARQQAFDDEVDALKQAKAILSGSDFQAAVAAAPAP